MTRFILLSGAVLLITSFSVVTAAYDSSLGPCNRNYTSADLQQQRAAGATLASRLRQALQQNASSFAIAPGTYRINESLTIQGTTNFSINASEVEIIGESGVEVNWLNIFENTNFSLSGPLYLDSSPNFGFTQGVIAGTDNNTYIDIKLMPSYPSPVSTQIRRLQFFYPNGTMLPVRQVTVSSVSSRGNGSYRLVLPDYFWQSYSASWRQLVATGNLLSMEQVLVNGSGGIYIRGNNGVKLEQIAVYSASLLFGQYESGPVFVDQFYGVRRPGTSRLGAGGWAQVSFQGGSWEMINSELGYNFDDLTNIGSGATYAYNQTSPRQVYMPFVYGRPLSKGDTITFYNLETFANDGTAQVASVQLVNNTRIGQSFSAALLQAGLTNLSTDMIQVTLDQSINLTSQLSLVDIEEYRTQYMVFENCYMHDGLAAGISGKGSLQYIVRNNSVVRAGSGGIATSVDPYWWEGGIAGNIAIQDNTVEQSPFAPGEFQAAITTTIVTSGELLATANFTTFNNVTVSGNTILNVPGPAIAMQFASNINVTGNTIINPMTAVADDSSNVSIPLGTTSAIFFDVIGGHADISGNLIVGTDPQNVPQVIRARSGTNTSSFRLCSNAASTNSQQNILRRLPNEIWAEVTSNSSAVSTNTSFTPETFETSGSRGSGTVAINTTTSPATATFSFQGTGVQFLSCIGPQYGLARIYLDGEIIQDVDASITPNNVSPDSEAGFCDQSLFSARYLPNTQHALTVENLQQEGFNSNPGGTEIAIGSFAYLRGVDQCFRDSNLSPWSIEAEAMLRNSYKNWVGYRSTGIVGPNISTVSFASSLQTGADVRIPSVQPLMLSPLVNASSGLSPGFLAAPKVSPIQPPSLSVVSRSAPPPVAVSG